MKRSKVDFDRLRQLYSDGLDDTAVGAALDVSRATAVYWRNRLGIVAKFKARVYTTKIDYSKVEKYYREGLCDAAIADKMNISYMSVFNWRKKNKLDPSKPIDVQRIKTRRENAEIDNSPEFKHIEIGDSESLFSDTAFLEKIMNKKLTA